MSNNNKSKLDIFFDKFDSKFPIKNYDFIIKEYENLEEGPRNFLDERLEIIGEYIDRFNNTDLPYPEITKELFIEYVLKFIV